MILASVSPNAHFGLVRGSTSHPEALPPQPWPRPHLKRHGPASSLSWERQAMRFQSLSCNAHSGPRRGDEKPGRWESQLPVGSVPLSLADRYRNVCQPARKNMRYSVAVQEFVEASILAFECGHSEESLRQEIPAAGADESPFDGSDDQEMFYAMLAIPWLTLLMAPKATVKRWGTSSPVSEPTKKQWKGFVAMIVNAYFEKRWAWYPIEPLEMEMQMASGGGSALPADVAEMARLVYTTLECAAPQFPR